MVDFSAGYSSDYDDPYFSGVALADSSLVPGTFQVAVNGHPYLLNTDPQAIESYGDNFREESLALLRTQADQGRLPGEQSLSPSQFWRRSADDWRSGAGQSMFDRETSEVTRFSASKGIDPWTRYQLTLHNSTSSIRSSANNNLLAIAANTQVYVVDGTSIIGSANLTAWTTVTGTPGAAATDLATNGAVVWSAHGASGIYATNGFAAASYVTGTVDRLGWMKGRLIAAAGGALYNPITAGALPGAFFTLTDTGWAWTAFAEGTAYGYAAGSAGDTSRIYRFTVKDDGTGLTVPVVAATLPTGETVTDLYGYLGFLVIGTSKGVRFATAGASGDLTLGALVPTPGPVYCLDAADRFVWFGWSNFDLTSSGLGRFDLQVISDGLAPAYASDLMATAQGTVRGMALVGSRRVFTVDAVGVFVESTGAKVDTGYVTSGQIGYGISDAKVPLAVDLKHAPLPAGTSIVVSLSLDRAGATTIGSSATTGSVGPAESISTGSRRCEEAELTITLNASAGVGPTLNRWTLLSYPAPVGASIFVLPLILATTVRTFRDTEYAMDPAVEYEFLRALNRSREVFTVQVGPATFDGTLEEFTWLPERLTPDQRFWDGTFIAKIRRIT